jgi:hypothetical protein
MPAPAIERIERARIEVARVRGWTSRGAHDRAAQALDAALCALAEAEAGAMTEHRRSQPSPLNPSPVTPGART